MRDDTDERRGDFAGPLDLPDEHEAAGVEPDGPEAPSLFDEIGALVGDGKTYAEAELAFQKSRFAYAADRTKGAIAYGVGVLAFLHLALIALAVGLVLALAPLIGAWAATGVVTGLLLAGALYFGFRLKSRLDEIADAFRETRK